MLSKKHFQELADILGIVKYHLRTGNKYAETVLISCITEFCESQNQDFNKSAFNIAIEKKYLECSLDD